MHIQLEIEAKQIDEKPRVHAFVTVRNMTNTEIRFEKYRLGLESALRPPTNNFFEVRAGDRQVKYKGMMMKRGKPKHEDFIILKPGEESARGRFDLSEAYHWGDPNSEFTIWYDGVASSAPVKFRMK